MFQHLWRAGTSCLLLGTVKGEVVSVGEKSSEEEGKCRKMGVSDWLGSELVPLGVKADKATLAPGMVRATAEQHQATLQ